MFEELTNNFLIAPGIRHNDCKNRYTKSFPFLDYSSLRFEKGVKKILQNTLSSNAVWEPVAKGELTGNSGDAQVFKVIDQDEIYYLKFTTSSKVQLAMLIAYHYLKERPHPFCTTAKIVSHGTVAFRKNRELFFMLLTKAEGEDLSTAFKGDDSKRISSFVETVGKVFAYNHSTYVSKANQQEKFFYATRKYNTLLEDLYNIRKKTDLDRSLDFGIQKAVPWIIESEINYLAKPQVQSLSLGPIKIWNLAFSDLIGKISIFDTTDILKYFAPSKNPQWSPEADFATFLHHLDNLETLFNLEPAIIDGYKDKFLEAYYRNVSRPIMSKEGLRFFLTQRYLSHFKKYIHKSHKQNRFQEKALSILSQCEELHKKQSPKMDKLLGF